MWRQRSRVFWLKQGDSNSYFHKNANGRRRKNTIRAIQSENEMLEHRGGLL